MVDPQRIQFKVDGILPLSLVFKTAILPPGPLIGIAYKLNMKKHLQIILLCL